MSKQNKFKKIISWLFIIFMIIQPLFDIFYLYSDNLIAIFKFSPSTIIRILIMGLLFLFTFIWSKDKNKYKYFIIMCITYLGYTILHHLNSLAFYVPYGNFGDYSTIKELFYIIRMMCPILIIYVTYEEDIKYDIFKKIVIWVALIFSSVMIVSNFCGFALVSYGGGNYVIKATFFDWFKKGIYNYNNYVNIASKGIFHMANQVSGVLICLLPIINYLFLKEKKALYGITLFMTLFSMIMLGTRVASYGWILVCASIIIIYLFFCIIKKELKFNIKIFISNLIIIAIIGVLLPYSPVMNRAYITDNDAAVTSEIKKVKKNEEVEEFFKTVAETNVNELDENEKEAFRLYKISFFEKYHVSYGFDIEYSERIYPFTEDIDFWISEMSIPFKDRANHRQLKTDITKRIIKLNDNKYDYLVGMSFTRLRNAPCYMENDIYVHLYSIGIIGIILFIFPYFAVLLYAFVKVFKNYKEKFTFLNITLMLSISLMFLAGMFSGNVFDEWICTLFLGFICGYLLLNLKRNGE